MAYHLSHEARAGLAEFRIPKVFGDRLFDFQAAAVKIAAHHLNKRNGVLIGDVVGLGKTIMATAVARIFEDDYGLETLILCPKNLATMWEWVRPRVSTEGQGPTAEQGDPWSYLICAAIGWSSLTRATIYRIVKASVTERFRNTSGPTTANASYCPPLPTTGPTLTCPTRFVSLWRMSKTSAFAPRGFCGSLGEVEFSSRHQMSPRTIAAFDKSEHADDWRDLMRLYLVRRTRSFIQDHYAETDHETGRKFLTYQDGGKSFFPTRVPKTVKFDIDEADPSDQYAQLYAQQIVDTVNALHLPRYGPGNYIADSPEPSTNSSGGEAGREPLPGWQATHGILPHESLQAP